VSTLSDDELAGLIQKGDADHFEMKQDWSGDVGESIRQAVCGFANNLSGDNLPGYIVVGANGEPHPLVSKETVQQNLAALRQDGQIVPPPSISVAVREIAGHDIVLATVLPSDSPPVRYKGRIFIRVGSRRGTANAQDERVLNEKRKFRDRSFDTHPIPSATKDALDRDRFELEYLPKAVARDVLAENGRSYEERLASCGFVSDATTASPTVVGLLTLGNAPRDWIPCAYIQFVRIAGTELSDPYVDEKEISGPLVEMIERIIDVLKSHNRTMVDFAHGESTERRRSDFPMIALVQLVHNAVMHRTYEATNSPVRITWFDDRIEIMSPGVPYGLVNAENFGTITDYRNPKLAEVMKTLGFVQRFGAGISTAKKALQENGNPQLQFEVTSNAVVAVINKAT
jgi:ATP-dependent DNA helicase RecG